MKLFSTLLFVFICNLIIAQNQLSGKIFEVTEKGDTSALTGATLYWLKTNIATNSDVNGNYSLNKTPESSTLVIAFVGFENDTSVIDTSQIHVDFYLSNAKTLKAIEVVYRKKSSEYSYIDPMKMEMLTQKELAKAACCNLSESFETNPSVDVSFADAVTGTKQIQMLGLAGQYSLITKENMPYLRGLASIYGLSFIPGSWIQSIQLSKGAGSVINGYESFTGQINTELQKPDNSEKLFFNAYANSMSRNEYNLNLSHRINDVWSTGLLMHANFTPLKNDLNHDGFLDLPTGKQYNIMNRWSYQTIKGFQGQFGGSYVIDDRIGGQVNFNSSVERNAQPYYGIG
ncbi:MAG TPA: carboxypeptidase-like regulatory domain-containing protein, partial [Bacteroidia bacterium]|nr:carboxypeptidase-like regulatory domain-containing protein [Bacteroidia bacterium]